MVIEGLSVNDLINSYPLDTLKCFERPKLILTEYMRPNAMLYRLLFNELKYSKTFECFLEEKTGIKFIKVVENLENFHDSVLNKIESGIPILLTIDHLYEELWKNFVPDEHEQHTVIVKGYDDWTCEYILIDEDYAQDYFSPKNTRQRMVYCDRRIDKRKLYMLAANAYKAFANDSDFDENHFVYYYPVNLSDQNECSLAEIEYEFRKLIKNVNDDLEKHFKLIKYGLDCAISDFDLILNSDRIDYSYKYTWLNYDGYGVPNEFFLVFERATTLKMYQIFFEKMGFHDCHRNDVISQLQIVRNYYERCKNLFRKAVFSKKVECCQRISDLLGNMEFLEAYLYKLLLESSM